MIHALAFCALLTAPVVASVAAPVVPTLSESGVAARPGGSEAPPAIPARVSASTSHTRLCVRHERPLAAVTAAYRLEALLVEARLYHAPFLTPRSPEETPSSQRDPPLVTRRAPAGS